MMKLTRRSILGAAVAASVGCQASRQSLQGDVPSTLPDHFDPWVEIVRENLDFNIGQIRKLSNDRPVLAVVKNNAYGLGLCRAAALLEPYEVIAGFAVVKVGAAIALRDAGVRKPILLMGMCSLGDGHELVARDIQLSLYTDDAEQRVDALSSRAGRPIAAHLYLDTGLGRMGMPYHRALPWLERLSGRKDLQIVGTFMAFTEESDFDPGQLKRFLALVSTAKARGIDLGSLHAASSNGVFHLPRAHLDMVRPGIALYGAYPSRPAEEQAKAELRPAMRLRCRVVRVVQLRPGDSAGYGRNYVADRPTWLATLPAGHVDGVPRLSVNGGRVLIGAKTYPIVGAVSASHCLVEIGADPEVAVGDVATLIGPDDPAIHPNALAEATTVSVYDVLMHLGPGLPRHVV